MIRAFAGVLDRRGAGAGAAATARLETALAGEGPVTTVTAGALTVACTGPAPDRDGDVLCLLDGVLDAGADGEPGLLRAWRRDGDAALAPLRGDFATVLWDERRRTGLLARDQLGLRGLVWHDDGAALRFACELHVLLALLPASPDVDTAGLARWLAIDAPGGDRTLLAGVRRVEAGCLVPLGERPLPARRWWTPRRPDAGRRVDGGAAAEQVRAALTTAVRRRATDPSSTGIMLSGGLDSSSVAGVAARQRGARRGYAAVFPDHPSVDEDALIARLGDAYELPVVRAVVRGGSVVAGAVPYIERFAHPPVSPNLFFWLPLLRRAHGDGIRVLLDGEGGDELFGLSPYLLADLLRRGRVAHAAALVRRVPGGDRGIPARTVASWLWRFGVLGLVPLRVHRAMVAAGRRPGFDWMRPQLRSALAAEPARGSWKELGGPRSWAWTAYATTRTAASLPLDHMRRRAALAGLVPRHPLLDIDLLELVLGLPPELAFDPVRSRPVLREAVRGIVPDEVRLRPAKSTFDAIFHEALSGPDLPVVRELLRGPDARLRAYADTAALDRTLLAAGPGGDLSWWALQVWRLLTAELWLRGLEDRTAPARLLGGRIPAPDVHVGDGSELT